jgi:hypothetical protein
LWSGALDLSKCRQGVLYRSFLRFQLFDDAFKSVQVCPPRQSYRERNVLAMAAPLLCGFEEIRDVEDADRVVATHAHHSDGMCH